MSEHADRATLFLSAAWKSSGSELSFVMRSIAGAASRNSRVFVVVPAPVGQLEPDGAFDLFGAGVGRDGRWPESHQAAWPAGLPPNTTVVVDKDEPAALAILDMHARALPRRVVTSDQSPNGIHSIAPLRFTGSGNDRGSDVIGLDVPINPLAATHRHNGLGFTGYILVLSDRGGTPPIAPPAAMVAWLTARFPQQYVVVVENATAAVWRGRVLRGVVDVYTRTDLWRLMAHARVTIDLAPGRIIARDCIESLRFGTPIIVPETSVARAHADAGGGLTYSGYSELLEGTARLMDDDVRATVSARGLRYADAQYGDQVRFVESVARILHPAPSHPELPDHL